MNTKFKQLSKMLVNIKLFNKNAEYNMCIMENCDILSLFLIINTILFNL